jgi:hypothetical protein
LRRRIVRREPGRPAIGRLAVPLALVGATSSDITGYGGTCELVIAVVVLSTSIVLFLVRRLLQDRRPLRFRERDDAATPGAETARATVEDAL